MKRVRPSRKQARTAASRSRIPRSPAGTATPSKRQNLGTEQAPSRGKRGSEEGTLSSERRRAAEQAPAKTPSRKRTPKESQKPSRKVSGKSGPAKSGRPASGVPADHKGRAGSKGAARQADRAGRAGDATSLSQNASQRKRAARKARGRRQPLVRPETETLLHLEDLLKSRIVGKDEAIQRVADSIRIRRTNLDFRPQRPDGSFLLVGPPGVGKSEFAHAVAEVLLGNESLVIDLDMADYTEEEDVEDLLVTAYPGVEGLLVEGALTTPMRKNPRSVILFHGIERAHPAVLRLMMHVLERGVISDAQGEVVFNEAIVFATTRLLFEDGEVVQQIGFKRSTAPHEDRVRRMLEDQFSPELVSAFNEVLFFKALTPEDVRLIARFKVSTVLERLKKQKRGVVISDRVWDTFIWEDEVRRTGARYLNRALEERLFTPLSKYLLEHSTARSILVDVRDRKLVIRHDES